MWEHIRKLKGENIKGKGDLKIYGEDGIELDREVGRGEVKNYWSNIYRRHENDITNTWNTNSREEYLREYERARQEIEDKKSIKLDKREELEESEREYMRTCAVEVLEHMDMARRTEGGFIKLEEESITEERVIKCLNKMKNKRAVGTDGIKTEMYKEIGGSQFLREVLIQTMKETLITGQVPSSWKESRTVMLPKTKRPRVKDLRPIALTNVGYKLMMAVMKTSIEDHIVNNRLSKEVQAGFTEGSRIENNIFILKYCIEKSFQMKTPLIIISIDFTKAYDSIKRGKMIEILMENKINPECIDFISKVYCNDKTIVELGEEEEVVIDVTSGIRQGCTVSTSLFKLITFKIIQKIEELNKGYRDDKYNITSLFYADDGMLLANNIENAKAVIKELEEVGKEMGLEMNKEKSSITVFHMKEKPESIENIKVKNKFKYLGITINDTRNCFKVQKEEMFKKAHRLANMTHSVIERSCSKILIGKTYWKSVALPSILYGINVIEVTETEIVKLQRIENGVFRRILGAPSYAPVATLRGEIGASSMRVRVREGQLKYLRHLLVEGNDLVRGVAEEVWESRQGRWVKKMVEEMRKLREVRGSITNETKESIKIKMQEIDTRQWKEELNEKGSLVPYAKWRKEIGGQDSMYFNDHASELLYRCRSNTMQLKDRKRFIGEATECKLCGEEKEDLEHFLLWCPAYATERAESQILQQPYEEEVLGKLLFENNNITESKQMILKLWRKREKLMKDTENN